MKRRGKIRPGICRSIAVTNDRLAGALAFELNDAHGADVPERLGGRGKRSPAPKVEDPGAEHECDRRRAEPRQEKPDRMPHQVGRLVNGIRFRSRKRDLPLQVRKQVRGRRRGGRFQKQLVEFGMGEHGCGG